MANPKVSVLITAYNREAYLRDAIESAIAQTYDNVEIIIVDDASTDSTIAIANEFADRSNVRVTTNPRNLGQFQNRNFAATLADGDYLKYVDSDDRINPECLEEMVAAMERFPAAGAGLCKESRPGIAYPVAMDPLAVYRKALLGGGLLNNAPTSTIYRRSHFELCGGFSTEATISDTLLLYKLAAVAPIVLLQDGLTWYRVHDDQVAVHLRGVNRRISEPVRYLRDIIYSENCPLTIKERDLAFANLAGNLVRHCARLMLRGRIGSAYKSWRAAGIGIASLRYGVARPQRPYQYQHNAAPGVGMA